MLTVTLLSAGCQHLEPRWLIDRLPGDYPEVTYYFPIDTRQVALTIDDGPDPDATPALLDVLRKHQARATFFLVSDAMRAHPELVHAILSDGHEIGNHLTIDEPSARLPAGEFIDKLEESAAVIASFVPPPSASEETSANTVRWFRPGHGRYNATMKKELAARGYRIALASMLPLDAKVRAPGWIAGYIKRSIEPGSIIVLHSVGKRGMRAATTLEQLLPALDERGYMVTTLSATAQLATAQR